MKVKLAAILCLLLLFSCKEQEARRPKTHSTQSFYKEVLEKNKKLNALEKKRLEKWISQDTINNYKASAQGFWYVYQNKDTVNTITPKLEDVVKIRFDIVSIAGDTLYNTQEREYNVDKEDFIPALQDGIKLMKKGETITFVIPSYRAFGVTGDGNKIGINQPIKSTVTLIDIKSSK
ncbi:gliding motility-associated peptidyl-prolyl isomerase GldI [uncultured Tenacibaculum sp.]|uniref:gliding motility-associated peptidyl-prolyl isomerase GldI n=1 Tax=uncultured Tenacibaculum sp. TaxID=174713 RepID=UPI00262C506C|nr:gliding motility-associated peptidyl-prolyl isomerase GldI [uncultured Tenacibaculum sp.]